ncbi:MAG: response regulator [Candidatus Aminicenantes bacterium]|nr:response regulator [Candidatus Aminicenantes bacterium]
MARICPTSAEDRKALPQNGSRAKVLIVEDEAIIARDISQVLTKLGHTVLRVVATGEDSIREARLSRPDIVLMDISLKGEIDGVRAAAIIQSRFRIPVVYLTAFCDPKTVDRAWSTKPLGFLRKPFEERDLEIILSGLNHKNPAA